MTRIPICNMLIIVDSHTIWHLQGGEIQVHISLSNRNALEGLNSGLEGVNWDTNLFFSIFVPVLLKKFCILASSFLHLNIGMSFKTPDHLVDPLFV